jgi:hypothetical protein
MISTGKRVGYWLGGFCEKDRVWKWVNGEPWNYTNWAPGEPNNYQKKNEDKVAMLRFHLDKKISGGPWNDATNTNNNNMDYGYIIEWD